MIGNIIRPNDCSGGGNVTVQSHNVTLPSANWSDWGGIYYQDVVIDLGFTPTTQRIFADFEVSSVEYLGAMWVSVYRVEGRVPSGVGSTKVKIRAFRGTVLSSDTVATINLLIV